MMGPRRHARVIHVGDEFARQNGVDVQVDVPTSEDGHPAGTVRFGIILRMGEASAVQVPTDNDGTPIAALLVVLDAPEAARLAGDLIAAANVAGMGSESHRLARAAYRLELHDAGGTP